MKGNDMRKKIIHFFVLSCKKATLLIEKQLYAPLSPIEKLQLRTHLSLCKNCISYQHKADFINRLLANEQKKALNENHFTEKELDDLKEKFKIGLKRNSHPI